MTQRSGKKKGQGAQADFKEASSRPFQDNLKIADILVFEAICGPEDSYIKDIAAQKSIRIKRQGDGLILTGAKNDVQTAKVVLNNMIIIAKQNELTPVRVEEMLKPANENGLVKITTPKKTLAMTKPSQAHYINTIKEHDISFGVGPAGTGKTYIATLLACEAKTKGLYEKIIITRPAVDAGEKLGFLPGDAAEKLAPYMRPIYDALEEAFGKPAVLKMLSEGIIEISPIAFMRGRTLKEAIVIVDEAQNTTPEQMKMVLTRLGQNSKMIITGDITQNDLQRSVKSGLTDILELIDGNEKFGLHEFDSSDIVRHPMVEEVVKLYEARDNTQKPKAQAAPVPTAP